MIKELNKEIIILAIKNASKIRTKRKDVSRVLKNIDNYATNILEDIITGKWRDIVKYRPLEIINNNGKERHILSPNFYTLILQHLALLIIVPIYDEKDNMVGLNCKPGSGITSKRKNRSVIKKLKHIYYDRRDFNYAVIIDQRRCYEHITKKQLRKALKYLTKDKELIDFCIDISFCGKRFPVGTPTSPPMHHIIMLAFDKWIKSISSMSLRYADDVFIPARSKEEAQEIKWRVKNFWWYTYGIRAKRHTQKVISLELPIDFCGYVFHRIIKKTVVDHNKGYVTIRKNIYNSAINCKTNESYSSYFGLLQQADLYNTLLKIEKSKMNIRELTNKIKLTRSLDAENVDMKELATNGTEFTILDYDLRQGSNGESNWIKCLISYKEPNPNINPFDDNMITVVKEYHTTSDSIIKYHALLEKYYKKEELLPIEGVVLVQSCGFIYKGSTNMITTLDDYYNSKTNKL